MKRREKSTMSGRWTRFRAALYSGSNIAICGPWKSMVAFMIG
jgi:hypothetical protein